MLGLTDSALIVIDMQNDFCDMRGYYSSVGWPIKSIRAIIPNIQKLAKIFRQFERPVIFTATIYEPDGADTPHKRHKILPKFADRGNAALLVRNAWGAEIINELKPKSEDYVVKKRRFSAFYNTDLEIVLRSKEIKTLVLTGIITYVCVEHTARDAFIRDFDVIVVRDAVAGWDKKLHQNSLESMAWSCALIVDSDDILQSFSCTFSKKFRRA